MGHDATCVYHAANPAEADIVVAWLQEQGLEAYARDRFVAGTLQLPGLIAPEGLAVCVVDAHQADRARALLVEHGEEVRRNRELAPVTGGRVAATCEECGRTAEFPGEQRGTVQTCPHCRAHVDVPEV